MLKSQVKTRSCSSSKDVSLTEVLDQLNSNRLYMESEFDKPNKSIQALVTRLDNLETRQNECENSLTYCGDEIEDLKHKIKEVEKSTTQMQKQDGMDLISLNKTLEIRGIPPDQKEHPVLIAKTVAEKLGCPISTDNIDVAYRSKSKQALVVRFMQTHIRDKILEISKRQSIGNRLTGKDLGYKTCKDLIYINEHLSFENRSLFFLAREHKKKHKYKYAWTKNQKTPWR